MSADAQAGLGLAELQLLEDLVLGDVALLRGLHVFLVVFLVLQAFLGDLALADLLGDLEAA